MGDIGKLIELVKEYKYLEEEMARVMRDFLVWLEKCDMNREADEFPNIRERFFRLKKLKNAKREEIEKVFKDIFDVEKSERIESDDKLIINTTISDPTGESVFSISFSMREEKLPSYQFEKVSPLVNELISFTDLTGKLMFESIAMETSDLAAGYLRNLIRELIAMNRFDISSDMVMEATIDELMGSRTIACLVAYLKRKPMTRNEIMERMGMDLVNFLWFTIRVEAFGLIKEENGIYKVSEKCRAVLDYMKNYLSR